MLETGTKKTRGETSRVQCGNPSDLNYIAFILLLESQRMPLAIPFCMQ